MIATTASNWSARKEAKHKLGDEQGAIEEVAKNDPNYYNRYSAVAKLTNQSILEEVALQDEEGAIRSLAVRKSKPKHKRPQRPPCSMRPFTGKSATPDRRGTKLSINLII